MLTKLASQTQDIWEQVLGLDILSVVGGDQFVFTLRRFQ